MTERQANRMLILGIYMCVCGATVGWLLSFDEWAACIAILLCAILGGIQLFYPENEA